LVPEAHIETLRIALAKAEAAADRNLDELRRERERIETMTVDMLRLTREAMAVTAAKGRQPSVTCYQSGLNWRP
jgi:hypothetical protein